MRSTKAIDLLYCCSDSQRDEDLRKGLEKHLSLMKRQGVINTWDKGMISAGKEWENEIDTRLNTANIILLLISSDLIYSDYHWEVLVKRAMERHKAREARVIVVLLNTYDNWKSEFSNVKVLPDEEKPVTRWRNYDHAFENIAKGVREEVNQYINTPFVIKSLQLLSKRAANAFSSLKSQIISLTSSSPANLSKTRQQGKALVSFAKPISIIFLGVGALTLVAKNSNIFSASSDSKPHSNLALVKEATSTGWIWLGMVKDSSNSLSVGKQLFQTSDPKSKVLPSINPPVVPSPGKLVTIKHRVNLKENKSLSGQPLDVLEPGEKLVVLKVERFENATKSLPYVKLRAQVRKCDDTCNPK